MRRHLRKVLFGVTLIIFLSPTECVEFYCSRSDRTASLPGLPAAGAPICDDFFVN